MWVVVHFTDEDNVEAVPKSWYKDELCWWPFGVDNSKIVKLIEKGVSPNEENWRQLPARKLGKTYDILASARSARNKAQLLSEFSDSSPTGKGLRKKVPVDMYSPEITKKGKLQTKRHIVTSSDDDEMAEGSLSPYPQPVRRSPRKLQKNKYEAQQKVKKSLFLTKSLTEPTQPVATCSKTLNVASSGTSKSCGVTSNQFEKEVLRSLNLIKSLLRKVSEQIENLDEKVEVGGPKRVQTEEPSMDVDVSIFPFKTEANVTEFEEGLDDKGKKTLVEILSSLGGTNEKDVTKRILRFLFTDELASKYSFMGLKLKKSFKDLKLANIIQESVMKNKNSKGATIKDVEDVIKNWLRVAKYRAGSKKAPVEGQLNTEDNV